MTDNEVTSRSSKHTLWLVIAGAAIILIAVLALLSVLPKNVSDANVRFGNETFTSTIAKTIQERETGLSGVSTLSSNHALLMVFPTSGEWEIWMKDMKIPLDIVWLNQDKQVIYIVKDALPKDSTNVIFSPSSSALYVLELPAGTVQAASISMGQTATFKTITQGVS